MCERHHSHRTEANCYLCRIVAAELAARVERDNGVRHDLDDVIVSLGFTRAELEADDNA